MRRLIPILVVMATAVSAATLKSDQKAAPSSGAEHPFYKTMTNPDINAKSKGSSKSGLAGAKFEIANGVPFKAEAKFGEKTIPVTLEATAETPKDALAYLARTLSVSVIDPKRSQELLPLIAKRGDLMKGQPEVRLPPLKGPKGEVLVLNWPDGWEMVRPNVIRLRPEYAKFWIVDESDDDVGRATLALTGAWTGVRGVLQCQAPDETAPRVLPFVDVEINGVHASADDAGAFAIAGDFREVDRLTVRYDGRVTPVSGVATGPRMSVMNDFHNPRSENVDVATGITVDGVLDVGSLTLTSLDCDLFAIGAGILDEFHQMTRLDPPAADDFRIKRWEGVYDGTPYAYYDYVVIAKRFQIDYSFHEARRETLRHEFGHTLRHAADGDAGHWGWDNFRWVYARTHSGNEVFNEHYAFNEGWAQYWECTIFASGCPSIGAGNPGIAFLDWNELQVGQRLFAMSRAGGVGHAAMFGILRDNPGSIHTLIEFERRYCSRFTSRLFCRSGEPARTKRACPPGFTDDGATCRLNNILAKDSYGRGVGSLPTGCTSGEYDAGICRDPCRPGFDGVGPVCWRRCPPGMHDDGAFCRRDVQIIGSDNSRCPGYDLCGLTFARGCSRCPAGFQNDGCTCRIDAWIFAKESYGRGVGSLPTACAAGEEYWGGICYPVCRAGFSGVGPVCWGTCPAGYADHGATCYREPNILVKY